MLVSVALLGYVALGVLAQKATGSGAAVRDLGQRRHPMGRGWLDAVPAVGPGQSPP